MPELAHFGPFTSKDVDFFGHRHVAQQLADALGGQAKIPTFDDHICNTALVTASVDGYQVTIDFLSYVLGVGGPDELPVTLCMTVGSGDGATISFNLRIMHPVHCLMSRVNTIMSPAIGRRDAFALRQIQAAYHIVKHFIHVELEAANIKAACECFNRLHSFMLSDNLGRLAHVGTPIDPLDILKHFEGDSRLDGRYRTLTLGKMIGRIENKRRSAYQRLSARGHMS